MKKISSLGTSIANFGDLAIFFFSVYDLRDKVENYREVHNNMFIEFQLINYCSFPI